LIDKFDLVTHGMMILLSNPKFIEGEALSLHFMKTYEDVDSLI